MTITPNPYPPGPDCRSLAWSESRASVLRDLQSDEAVDAAFVGSAVNQGSVMHREMLARSLAAVVSFLEGGDR